MTTEECFQSALDVRPGDWQTRLVFADWLQERGDPRAEGYRALGVLRLAPWLPSTLPDSAFWYLLGNPNTKPDVTDLPKDWFRKLKDHKEYASHWREYTTRRAAEDAAALAFSRLPAERRAELLATVAV